MTAKLSYYTFFKLKTYFFHDRPEMSNFEIAKIWMYRVVKKNVSDLCVSVEINGEGTILGKTLYFMLPKYKLITKHNTTAMILRKLGVALFNKCWRGWVRILECTSAAELNE